MFRYRNVVITLSCVGVVDERQNICRAVPLLYTLTDRRGNLRPLPTQQVVADNAGGISRAGSTAYPRIVFRLRNGVGVADTKFFYGGSKRIRCARTSGYGKRPYSEARRPFARNSDELIHKQPLPSVGPRTCRDGIGALFRSVLLCGKRGRFYTCCNLPANDEIPAASTNLPHLQHLARLCVWLRLCIARVQIAQCNHSQHSAKHTGNDIQYPPALLCRRSSRRRGAGIQIYKFRNRARSIDKRALYLLPSLRDQSEKTAVQQSAVPLRCALHNVFRNSAAPLPVYKHAVRILRNVDNARLQYRIADDRLPADARAGNQPVRNVIIGSHPHRKRIRRVRSRISPHRNLYGRTRRYMPYYSFCVQIFSPRKLSHPNLKPETKSRE